MKPFRSLLYWIVPVFIPLAAATAAPSIRITSSNRYTFQYYGGRQKLGCSRSDGSVGTLNRGLRTGSIFSPINLRKESRDLQRKLRKFQRFLSRSPVKSALQRRVKRTQNALASLRHANAACLAAAGRGKKSRSSQSPAPSSSSSSSSAHSWGISIDTPLNLGSLSIPRDRVPNWTTAGVDGGIPVTSNWPVLNALDFGASPACDMRSDGRAIQSAIDQAASLYGDGRKGTVVLLPAGCYTLIGEALRLKSNVVLKGEGRDRTFIEETTKYPSPIRIEGTLGAGPLPVVSGAERGSTQLLLGTIAAFSPGQYLFIEEDKNPAKFDETTYSCHSSQVIRIAAASGNSLTLDRPLRDTFSINARVTLINAVSNSGVEDLKLSYPSSISDSPGYYDLLSINLAASSWIKNVHLFWGDNGLLGIGRSRGITVESNVLEYTEYNAPVSLGGAGQKWNSHMIAVNSGATDTLVWDNVFSHNEQVVKYECAPIGNVFAYNYATELFPSKAFTYVHGWHPSEILFESNVVEDGGYAMDDDWWGRQGPRIIWFRNRHLGSSDSGFTSANMQSYPIGDLHAFIGNVGTSVYQTPGCNSYGIPNCFPIDFTTMNFWGEKNRFTELSNSFNPAATSTLVPEESACPQNSRYCAGFIGPRYKTCNGYCYADTGYDGKKAPASWANSSLPPSLFRSERPPFWCQELPWPSVGADLDVLDNLVRPLAQRQDVLPAQRWYAGLPCTR